MEEVHEVFVGVTKVTNGYLVETNKGRQIVVSLAKVMKIVKELLKPELVKVIGE